MDGSAFPAAGPSVTITSVVSSSDAIDAACCSATRSTLVGSMIPATIMSTYSWVSASKPRVRGTMARTFSTITEPGVLPEHSDRLLEGALHDADTGPLITRELEAVERVRCAQQRHATAGHDPFLDGRPRGVARGLD